MSSGMHPHLTLRSRQNPRVLPAQPNMMSGKSAAGGFCPMDEGAR